MNGSDVVNPIRILHVEDSQLDADLIASRLRAGGVEATFERVETRDDFIRAVDAHCFDLVLADYSLPSFDGLSALSIARERCPDVPFIFVSGVLGEEVAVETLQKGATDYVLKARLNRLVPAVSRALAESRERNARRHAEEGLRIAAETAKLGFWQMDVGTGAIECSATYKSNFGLPAEAAVDRETLLAMIHPEDREGVRRQLDEAIEGRADYHAEYRVVWRDGSVHWVLARGRGVYAPNGMPQRVVGVSIDITERRRVEQEIREAKEAAEAANRSKDHFLAILSHELRTPLSPILTTIHLMELEQGLGPEMREYIEIIRRNVELEARLIDDLLDLTRITRGKLQLHTQAVDVHGLIDSTVEICCGEATAKRHEVRVERGAGRATVSGDSARLQQVLWNLLKNAIKFTPIGGSIVVRTRNEAGNDGHAGEERVVVEVEDTGIGIEAGAVGRIFNAFEQADHRVMRQYGGLGLGLAIAKALVEMHGGTVTCRSGGPGRGATFTVSLPAVGEAAPASRKLGPVAEGGKGLRILLVEDHADTARAMASLLKMRGHQVRHASSVVTALGLVGAEQFDLLISDLGLPDGTGIDVVKQPAMKDIPAIALTGYGSDEDVARCRAAGFAHHLTKPVSFDKLEAAIRELSAAGEKVG